jgi:cation diffusion facilitator CzcD-associated flavoprotein CzcO
VEKHFSSIAVFEQRSAAGGIWNTDSASPAADISAFPSPIYDNLESNIPSVTMQYFNSPFPEDCPLLPNADAVLKYLREHAADIIDLVAFRKQVLDVRSAGSDSKDDRRWAVKVLELETKE